MSEIENTAKEYMFMGTCSHSLDAKGRIIMPAKYRDDLGAKFVITRGLDKCLFVYPMDVWKSVLAKLAQLSDVEQGKRKFKRHMLGNAEICDIDKQGRVLIPPILREHAGLEKEIILSGNLNKIEIWAKNTWEDECTYDDISDVLQHLAEENFQL